MTNRPAADLRPKPCSHHRNGGFIGIGYKRQLRQRAWRWTIGRLLSMVQRVVLTAVARAMEQLLIG